ncbi:MAG: hypothetical protein Q7R87_01555 [Nanoarchaeota archaeon]|nr:hypothetical protein [Nanoarchaeota archaeon]
MNMNKIAKLRGLREDSLDYQQISKGKEYEKLRYRKRSGWQEEIFAELNRTVKNEGRYPLDFSNSAPIEINGKKMLTFVINEYQKYIILEEIEQIIAFCKERNLKFFMRANDYFYGSLNGYIYQNKEEGIKLTDADDHL